MNYSTIQEDVNRLRAIMNIKVINEGIFGNMHGTEMTPEKKEQALMMIKNHPNRYRAYTQFQLEDPNKADKYVEFFAIYPNGYPKWDGEKFVEQVPTPFLNELENENPESDSRHMSISLSMAIMSHLSDLQEECPAARGKINFIKALFFEFKKGKTDISKAEIDKLYNIWGNHQIGENQMQSLEEEGTKSTNRLDVRQKKQVNTTIARITKPTYFDGIPLGAIREGLYEHGIVLLQEDQTEWSGIFTGREGQANIALGFINTKYKGNNDIDTYEEIVNAALTITWYKMTSGKYEIVAYIG